MKTYSADSGNNNGSETVIILEKKEGQRLVKMARAAADGNKRKRSWAELADQLDYNLSCY